MSSPHARLRRYGSAPPDFPDSTCLRSADTDGDGDGDGDGHGHGIAHRRDAPLPLLPGQSQQLYFGRHQPIPPSPSQPDKEPVFNFSYIRLLHALHNYCNRHHRRVWPTELQTLIALLALLTLLALLLLTSWLWWSWTSSNMHAYWDYDQNMAHPKVFDGIFHPLCLPTFLESTCPAVLAVPPRLYDRLLEPSGAMQSYYRQMMKCWGADKAIMHPSPNVTERYLSTVRLVLERCRDVMGKGVYYPRQVWKTATRVGNMREVQHSGLWQLDTWTWPEAEAEAKAEADADLVLSLIGRKRPCNCSMDDAVYTYLGAPFTRYYHHPHDTPPPTTLTDVLSTCYCNISKAWNPYTHIFNLTFATTLLPIIPWSGDLRIALGWLVLRHSIAPDDTTSSSSSSSTFTTTALSPPFPISLLTSLFLPRPILHNFLAHNLPPQGAHRFWIDSSLRGLPNHSMRDIAVPDSLTVLLRRWGRDGVDRGSQVRRRRMALSGPELARCIKGGGASREKMAMGPRMKRGIEDRRMEEEERKKRL